MIASRRSSYPWGDYRLWFGFKDYLMLIAGIAYGCFNKSGEQLLP